MSEKQDQTKADPLEIQLEDLVAYLDGELSDVDADVVEKGLVVNSPLRKTAEELDRTWQLLDSLEEVAASQEFTQRTISSMMATTPVDDDEPDESRSKKSSIARRLAGSTVWLTAAFLFTAAGLISGKWFSDRNQNSSDAEVLTNLDFLDGYYRYHLIPSAEFLRSLEFPSRPADSDLKQSP